ncbi:Spy/CpxP family protein refolding chaperone [Falsiroseomonas sp. E2-1-a4]|uniref:Spy/CpxP family protein refolding chaperone n=1 Tax=Falsiroseomonas sp. E2-1-a4 TaxID=3239299 RepID=UPI003F3D7EB5
MTISRKAALGAAAAALIGIGAAWAQTGQPNGQGGQMGPGMMGQGMGPGMMGGDRMMPMMRGGMMGMMNPGMMGRHVEGRIAFLRAEIGVTPAQEAQWNALAEALRANARAMGEMQEQMMPMMQGGPQAAPLPQRLEMHERMMTSHLEALRRVRGAAGPLYAALDEGQKRIADTLMMGMM